MAILHEDLVALAEPAGAKGGRVINIVVLLLLVAAAHLRFDQHQALSGRLLAILALAAWIAGPVLAVARTSELRKRVLAEEHGFELLHAEIVATKRRRWERLAKRGLGGYINERAGRLALLILIPLYSFMILIAPSAIFSDAQPPSVLSWIVASGLALTVAVCGVVWGRRKAATAWQASDARAA